MGVTALEILHDKRAVQRSLALDQATREALAGYCRQCWPSNTAKLAAREWDLSADEARGIVSGRASQATIDRVFKHERGGWSVALPVLGAVIGHGLDDFISIQRRRHVENARRGRALVRDLRALAPDPRNRSGELGSGRDRERRSFGE